MLHHPTVSYKDCTF